MPSLFQSRWTPKEIGQLVGYENDFVEFAEINTAGAEIDFAAAIKCEDTSTIGSSIDDDVFALPASCPLVFILLGDGVNLDQVRVKELEPHVAAQVLAPAAEPTLLHELAVVRYTSPMYAENIDCDSTITHHIFVAHVVDPESCRLAQAAAGPVEFVEPARSRGDAHHGNLRRYTRHVAVGLLYEALKCAAARVFRTQLGLQTVSVLNRQSVVAVAREKLKALMAESDALQAASSLFIASWRDTFATQTAYLTNGEREVLRGRVVDAFDKAVAEEKLATAVLGNAIGQIQEFVIGFVRRKRMAPAPADMWAFRVFDPALTESMPTPLVRTVLFTAAAGVLFPDTQRCAADVTEELILMGKISHAMHFTASTIRYIKPK